MSNSRALAGLRVGYAIGDAGLIEALIRERGRSSAGVGPRKPVMQLGDWQFVKSSRLYGTE
jgi:hypothetical protein